VNICEECGKSARNLTHYGVKKVCSDCLHMQADLKEKCPNCGHVIEEENWVGITLRSLNPSAVEKAAGIEALAIVCPNCKIIFFDTFQFNIIKGLRDK